MNLHEKRTLGTNGARQFHRSARAIGAALPQASSPPFQTILFVCSFKAGTSGGTFCFKSTACCCMLVARVWFANDRFVKSRRLVRKFDVRIEIARLRANDAASRVSPAVSEIFTFCLWSHLHNARVSNVS